MADDQTALAHYGDAKPQSSRIGNPDVLLKVLAELEVEFEQLFAEWSTSSRDRAGS